MDFINGGGHLKGAGSAAAGIADSEDDDDDLSDTKPSKRKSCGTRSRPVRGTTPTVSKFQQLLHLTLDSQSLTRKACAQTDNLPGYRNDSPQTLASSAESLPRSSAFSNNDRSLLDRSRSDDYDHPIASRQGQGNTIQRPGSSSSNPDYRRISHFNLLRGGPKSDWPSPRLDNGAQHPSAGGLLSTNALLSLDAHHSGHHQEFLSNFARHRASALAHSIANGGPSIARRLAPSYSEATPPLSSSSLTSLTGGTGGGSGSGGPGGGSGPGGGDDSWLDFLTMPSTSMSLSLLGDHPTALGGSHASASSAYDFPFGLGLGGPGRGGGGSGSGGGLGIGSFGLPEGSDLEKERELLARQGANDFGPRKRPRWE